MKNILIAFLSGSLVACVGDELQTYYPPLAKNQLPFSCFPSGLGSQTDTKAQNGLKIAYTSQCMAARTPESATLRSMSLALMEQISPIDYSCYCTGTPLAYDASSGVGFVLTAAHCVLGNQKNANTNITAHNIITFSREKINNLFQGYDATIVLHNGMSAHIDAIYVPNQYCLGPAFKDGLCSHLEQQNGDFALLKVHTLPGRKIEVNPLLKLATPQLRLDSPSYILGLGYGITDLDALNHHLFYINYEYFGTNTYQGVSGQSSLMNGYAINNTFYNIICRGDSGGGDFYWDGSFWNLIGVHSFGPPQCGVVSRYYSGSYNASTDVRPFSAQIKQMMASDKLPTGCSPTAAEQGFVCASS